jgi:hypothetical protein
MAKVWKQSRTKRNFPWWPCAIGFVLGGLAVACTLVVLQQGPSAQAQVAPPCPTCDGTEEIVTVFDDKGTQLWQGSPLAHQRGLMAVWPNLPSAPTVVDPPTPVQPQPSCVYRSPCHTPAERAARFGFRPRLGY